MSDVSKRAARSKMLNLPYITDAIFVTNTRFSSEAETYAKHNEITIYDGDKLKNEFYLMSIGRLDSSSAAIQQQILFSNLHFHLQ
jgi:restriction endonuclease Mrr